MANVDAKETKPLVVRQLLRERNWTLERLGRALDVSMQRAHALLQPGTRPQDRTVDRIAAILGVNFARLVDDEGRWREES